MKSISFETEEVQCQKALETVINDGSVITIWQLDKETNSRIVHTSKLLSFDAVASKLTFIEATMDAFQFKSPEVFFYSEKFSFIFKSSINSDLNDHSIEVQMPNELKFLAKEEAEKIKASIGVDHIKDHIQVVSGGDEMEKDMGFISLDEEDKKFASVRAAPRARPKETKLVYLYRETQPNNVKRYFLGDLSQGGMGVLCEDENGFGKGDRVFVVALDSKKFDEPMVGTVMSVRAADAASLQFKVGVKWD